MKRERIGPVGVHSGRKAPQAAPLAAPTARAFYFDPYEPSRLEEAEKAFFSALKLSNGTFKATGYRRLDTLNALCRPLLPSVRPLEIMDVAVSSGVSTLEWIRDLEAAGVAHAMVAGDLLIDAYLLSVGPKLHVLIDPSGHFLQLDIGGKAYRLPLRRRDRVRHALPMLVLKCATRLMLPRLVPPQGSQKQPLQSYWGIESRAIKLVSPALTRRPDLEIVQDDILHNKLYQDAFHVVRAANILNKAYFDDATLTQMLSNLRSRLKKGGLLIVCRTDDAGVNHGSVFEVQPSGELAVLARLNSGSEIEALALQLPS